METHESHIIFWRNARKLKRTQLREKAKTQPLTEVETMILNPFTLEQAKNQVNILNRFAGTFTDKRY